MRRELEFIKQPMETIKTSNESVNVCVTCPESEKVIHTVLDTGKAVRGVICKPCQKEKESHDKYTKALKEIFKIK